MIKVYIEVYHHGDWTEKTENSEMKIYSINHLIDPINKYNVEVLLFYGKNQDKFLKNIKYHRNILDIIEYSEIKRNIYKVILKGKYEGSIRKSLFESKAITLSTIIEDGIEKYNLLFLSNSDMEKLRKFLEDKPNVTVLKFKLVDLNVMNSLQLLTPLEYEIMVRALNKGFFENPRKISLEELSEDFGISKATLNFHIRNAMKKILYLFLYQYG
ncbi:MAG: helix-turn-helix domain-containing protein [Sulfolobus sp.]